MFKPFKMSNFVPKAVFYLITITWAIQSMKGNDFVLHPMSNKTADIMLTLLVILLILELKVYFFDDGENDSK